MMFGVQEFQPLARNLCVDLCRRQVGVAEQHLYHTQIGSMIQQVCSKRMAQGVR